MVDRERERLLNVQNGRLRARVCIDNALSALKTIPHSAVEEETARRLEEIKAELKKMWMEIYKEDAAAYRLLIWKEG